MIFPARNMYFNRKVFDLLPVFCFPCEVLLEQLVGWVELAKPNTPILQFLMPSITPPSPTCFSWGWSRLVPHAFSGNVFGRNGFSGMNPACGTAHHTPPVISPPGILSFRRAQARRNLSPPRSPHSGATTAPCSTHVPNQYSVLVGTYPPRS